MTFGEGPEDDHLRKEARARGIQDRLLLGGFLDQGRLAAAYFLGTVFLLPSPSDTQGIVLYEARATGLPMVATESMASRAVLDSGRNGLLAEADPRAFADEIEKIPADPTRYRQPFPLEDFSPERLGRRYTQLYETLGRTGRQAGRTKRKLFKELIEEITDRAFFLTPGQREIGYIVGGDHNDRRGQRSWAEETGGRRVAPLAPESVAVTF